MEIHHSVDSVRSLKVYETLEYDFKIRHADYYNYDKFVFVDCKTESIVICPVHGEFKTTPSKHKIAGCFHCGIEITATKRKLRSKLQFESKARKIHGLLYDYSDVDYIDRLTLVTIHCKKHGGFEITPQRHLLGDICLECNKEHKREKGQNNFIEKAKQKYGNKFGYSEVEYDKSNKTVNIKCPNCGYVELTPASHLINGCTYCSDGQGFQINKPAILYYIRVETFNQICWKIGITNRTIEERFKKYELENITVIKEWFYKDGLWALQLETKIKRLFKGDRYKGDPILMSGNSELYNNDILKLDY